MSHARYKVDTTGRISILEKLGHHTEVRDPIFLTAILFPQHGSAYLSTKSTVGSWYKC